MADSGEEIQQPEDGMAGDGPLQADDVQELIEVDAGNRALSPP